jgi:4-hydroxy-L-threonine phosphate dehydrogenase PdxA
VVFPTRQGLKKFWGIKKPKVAAAALNPHAGESGRFGREEIDIIKPEINSLNQRQGINLRFLDLFRLIPYLQSTFLPASKNAGTLWYACIMSKD